MQRTVREVRCDRCGKPIKDHLTGFIVVRLNNSLYDLCNECNDYVKLIIADFINDLLDDDFTDSEGRPCEDGDR